MKKIIGKYIYDTEKAKKIFSYKKKITINSLGNINFYELYTIDIYKTKKENYFIHGYVENDVYKPFIETIKEKEVEKIIKDLNPDKYIEMGFEKLEEA